MKKLLLLALTSILATVSLSAQEADSYQIKVSSPNGAPALALATLAAKNPENYTFVAAETISAEFANNKADFIIAPINAGAKLYKMGKSQYKLAAVVTWGNLYFASQKKNFKIKDIKKSEITLFGENTINASVALAALQANKITAKSVNYLGSAAATQNLLLSDQNAIVLTAEPLLSAAKMKNSKITAYPVNELYKKAGGTVYTAGTVAEEWTDIITGTQGHDTILCDLSSMDGDVAIEVVFAAEPFSVEIHCESQQGGQGSVYHNDTSVCNDIITITTGHDDETLLIVAGEGSHTAAIRIGDRTVFENTVIAEGAPLSPQTAGRYDTIVCSLASLTADTTITAVFAPGNNDLSVGEATPYPNAAKQISVYAADGSIILKGDHIGKGCVYDEMGRCVARFDGGSQVVTIPVGKRGLYVVQTANHSYKVGVNL